MSYTDAAKILDMRRAGAEMPQSVVDAALRLTGDIDDDPEESLRAQVAVLLDECPS